MTAERGPDGPASLREPGAPGAEPAATAAATRPPGHAALETGTRTSVEPGGLDALVPASVRRLLESPHVLGWVVAVTLASPLLVGMVRALLDDIDAPSGDVALMEVRVRDVGSQNPVLGSYGRYGFNHPGPLLFYVLAIPYRLFGTRYAGMEIGVLALGVAAVAAVVWVARRRGGTLALLWVGLLLAVLMNGVGPRWVASPWEPEGLLLPSAALVLLATDAAAGRWWSLPPVAVTASLLGQAQATLLPFALALSVFALVGALTAARRDPGRRRPVGPVVVVTLVVTAVLWGPTAFDQLSAERGNLTAMVEAVDRPEPVLGLADGARLVALQLGHRGPWLGWPTPRLFLESTVDPHAAPVVPVGAVALVAALVVAVRRRLEARWLALAATVAAVAGVLSLARLIGPAFVWIPEWTRVIGFAAWAAVGWVVAALRAGTEDRLREPMSAVLLVALVGLSLVHAGRTATYDRVDDAVGRVVSALVRDAEPVISTLPEPVRVSSTAAPELVFGTDSIGIEHLVLALESAGVATVVDRSVADRFGSQRAQPERATAELRLALERSPVPEGFRVIATADPLTPTERAERLALLGSIGLGDEATGGDILDRLFADPSVRPVVERLQRYTDLPPFVLLLADPAP